MENDTEANMDVDQDQEASEDDLGVLEEPPEVFMMPGRKKKPFMVREQLDDSFLRHSHRLSKKADGYKDTKVPKMLAVQKAPRRPRAPGRVSGRTQQLRMNPFLLP